MTDANVALGRIHPAAFLGGDMQLDAGAAEAALQRLGERLGASAEAVALDIVDLVNFNMVDAIRLVSIDRGLDPRDFTLVSFGGACSLHAAALADIIGARDVLVPVHQGVFSAFGLMTADMRVDESVTASFRSDKLDLEQVDRIVKRLRDAALRRIAAEGYEGTPVLEPAVEMRYLGQNYSTDVLLALSGESFGEQDLEETIRRFEREHERLYGYSMPDEVVEFVHFKMTAVGPVEEPTLAPLPRGGALAPSGTREVCFRDAGWVETTIYQRAMLPPDAHIEGPAVVEEPMSTTLIPPTHEARTDAWGNLILRRRA